MKKFGKILVLVLCLAVVASAFVFASSAEDAPFMVEGLPRYTWAEAIDNADGDYPVVLTSDYVSESKENVEITSSVKIDLNGHKIDASKTSFTVSGKNTAVTLVGPGTISVDGTFMELVGDGAKLIIEGDEEIVIESSGDDSIFVLGTESAAKAEITAPLTLKNKDNVTLFELLSASSIDVTGANVKLVANGSSDASTAFLLTADTRVTILDSAVSNDMGYIFACEDTEAGAPVTIKVEASKLVASSLTNASILSAGSEHVNMTLYISEVVSTGVIFSADDTLFDYSSGAGYAKPTASVYITGGTVTTPAGAQSTVFGGNLTAVASGTHFEILETTVFAEGTRIWNGECGILLKLGTTATRHLISECSSVMADDSGIPTYFDPESSTNNNFSFDTINGKACLMIETAFITSAYQTAFMVVDKTPEYTIVSNYTTDFENADYMYGSRDYNVGKLPLPVLRQNAASTDWGYGFVELYEYSNASGDTNKCYRYGYDKAEYPKIEGYRSEGKAVNEGFWEIDLGNAGKGKDPDEYLTYNHDFITLDFDIATDETGRYATAASFQLFQRPGTNDVSSVNLFSITESGGVYKLAGYELPTTPYTWTHVTVILQIDNTPTVTKNGIVYERMGNSKSYIYVNGEYQATAAVFTGLLTSDNAHLMGLDAIRIFQPEADNINANTKSFASLYDNFVVTTYPDGYQGGINKILADNTLNLKAAGDMVYGLGYKAPLTESTDEPFAIVDGTKYYTEETTLAAIAEGSVVELFHDVETTLYANMSFTVHKNGNTLNIISDSHFISEIGGDKDTYKVLAANSFVSVLWNVNFGYETLVPIGVIPEYTGAAPAVKDANGTRTSLVGWSYSEERAAAGIVDDLTAITNADANKGYIILYPVYDLTHALVSYYDQNGMKIDEAWFEIGTSADKIIENNDGSSISSYMSEDGNYKFLFSGWEFENNITEVGRAPVNVRPTFNNIELQDSVISYNFSLIRLTRFSPNIYVKSTGLDGLVIDGVTLKNGMTLAPKDVTINGEAFKKIALTVNDTKSEANSIDSSMKLQGGTEIEITLNITYKGIALSQKITLNLEEYIEKLLTSDDSDVKVKTALMETVRMADTYLRLAGGGSYNADAYVFKKFLDNPEYSALLTSLDDMTEALKADEDINKNMQKWLYDGGTDAGTDALYEHFECFRWNFLTNDIDLHWLPKYHGVITTNDGSGNGKYFVQVDANGSQRIWASFDSQTNGTKYIIYGDTNQAWAGLTWFDAFTDFKFTFRINGVINYINPGQSCYNLAIHILQLTEAYEGGDTGVAAELEMAKTIYSTQLYIDKNFGDELPKS